MKEFIVLSPNVSCESARFLAEMLDAKYENPYETGNRDFSQYKYTFKYGFSRKIKANTVFNKTKNVEIAIDKLKFLNAFKGSGLTVDFTQDIKEATQWLKNNDCVVARNELDGSNGDGLVYCEDLKTLNNTPAIFWTKYVEHTNEFRVYLWKDTVISIYDKKQIDGHFQFVLFKGAEDNPQLVSLAKEVYNRVGLDWCGADVLRDNKGKLTLLEVNSGPILFPYTAKKLVNILKQEIK